jgi:phage/plasmid primase-like uncharacterized protein
MGSATAGPILLSIVWGGMATRLIEIGSIDIEAIRDAYPLATIVEPYAALKHRGNMWEALCPFHAERSPSFKIYPDQRYHCFGCGAHGDVFDFLEHMEGLSIPQVAEKLTGGVALPRYTLDRLEEIRAKAASLEREEQERRTAATIAARERWLAAAPNFLTHGYLEAKGIEQHGTRLSGDRLLVPLYGGDGKLQTLQEIDPQGNKLFPRDGTVTGGLFMLGGKISESTTPILVCEGFATAATLQQATGYVVICAFNSGNLVHVAAWLRQRYSDKEYLVAGDDDRHKERNPGREKGLEAASILGCRAVFPVFPDGDTGTDFNDMAHSYTANAVRALVVDGELPGGGDAPQDFGEIYPLLDMDALEALPPPTYLIDDLVPEHGLTVLYGDPGTKKSFLALDMSLRLAYGMEWHGKATRRTGVLYIAGEGKHGLGKRVKGWRKHHGLEGVDAPFMLLPVAVAILDADAIAKLKRTINALKGKLEFDVCLVVIDTVSRSMAGHDENKQDAMSQFVDGCTEIQNYVDGAVLGVHHSGKNKEAGMRGSTVLLGGVEAVLRVLLDEDGGDTVSIENEKQKDEEQAAPFVMGFRKMEWADAGLSKPISTLVPVEPKQASIPPAKTLSWTEIDCIFATIEEGWRTVAPWSVAPQAKRRGRYLPGYIADNFDISHDAALFSVMAWQQRDYLRQDLCDARNKVSGLRVIKRLERDQ